jgi:hypothetical protein
VRTVWKNVNLEYLSADLYHLNSEPRCAAPMALGRRLGACQPLRVELTFFAPPALDCGRGGSR